MFDYGEFTSLEFHEVVRFTRQSERVKHRRTRHHRMRVIEKRRRIVLDCWGECDHLYLREPGRLAKHNLSCNCLMCRWEKIFGIEKAKYREVGGDV